MKKVLVTGATGYIGSHLCKILKEKHYYVVGWDINLHGEFNSIDDFVDEFKKIDVTDSFKTKDYFDAVVHLAGLTMVPESVKNPDKYYNVNIQGTSNCLDRISTDHFLFAGTAAAWDMASPYAISKVAAEDIIKEKANGYTIFRFFNVSGTNGLHKQLGAGTHLIRMIAEVACGKKNVLEIFGNDYDTPDGTCIRDFIHVVDLANAIVNAVEAGPRNTPYECLGSAKGYSVLETVKTMEKAVDIKIPIKFVDRREGDVVTSIVKNVSPLLDIQHSLEDMCLDQYNIERKN